ncbi:MAG: hypothetical protein HC899_38045 [Leptolyngbyaceae cyanobacterium SM1_4_3]|nr:hypothetical protein [Leptolyngbyaceae cyanobacterium SM1_4_3]
MAARYWRVTGNRAALTEFHINRSLPLDQPFPSGFTQSSFYNPLPAGSTANLQDASFATGTGTSSDVSSWIQFSFARQP